MKKQLFTVMAIAAIVFTSCEPQNEDIVKTPSTDGSVEVQISTASTDKYDLLTIEKIVWVKGKIQKTHKSVDTIPSLGNTKEIGENEQGETKELVVPKKYELYITVK